MEKYLPGNSLTVNASNAINFWRLVLVLAVVLNHVLVIGGKPESNSISGIVYTTMLALTYGAVPLLSVFSGLLATKSRKNFFVDIIKQKTINLIAPFMFWNSFLFLLFETLYYSLSIEFAHFRLVGGLYWWANSLTAFHGAPFNAPLYFLRDLFVCFLLFSFVRNTLKKSWFFTTFILVFLVNSFFDFDGRIFIRNEIPLFFFFAVSLGYYPRIWPIFSAYRVLLGILSVVFITAYSFFEVFGDASGSLSRLLRITVGLFIFTIAFDFGQNLRISNLGKRYAFVIFLSHWPVLLILKYTFDWLNWSGEFFFLCAWFITVGICFGIGSLIALLPHPLGTLLSGGRTTQQGR